MFELLPDRFFNRIIPVDHGIAVKFGEIQAKEGPLPSLDPLRVVTYVLIVQRVYFPPGDSNAALGKSQEATAKTTAKR